MRLLKTVASVTFTVAVSVLPLTAQAEDYSERDPWEGLNRSIFAFNDTADKYVLKPIAKGYQWVTPDPVEEGVSNVFSNLWSLTTIVNDLLQLKFGQAAEDTGRFLVNSTVGLLGIFDVATPMGLEGSNEDFGQTLGYWGVNSGPYVVVPLFGPYTVRDGFGRLVDGNTDPVAYIDDVPTRNQTFGVRVVSDRAGLLEAEKLITGDRYTFIRDAYLQRRDALVNDGVVEDNFGDEDFDELDMELE
jgi:phospholipid-binding lipoprotein MlaA